MNIVLFGGPGSGKGTQAERLSKQFNHPHIASGDLFRENLKNETDLGILAKKYMDQGELVPDDITIAMVEERLSWPDASEGFILDGFPRTLPQAEALTKMLETMQRRLSGILYIKVSDAEIVRRLSGRLICRNCQTTYHLIFNPPPEENICGVCGSDELYQREDDRPETARARLKVFREQTAPLIDYHKIASLLVEVNGEGDVGEVMERIVAVARRF